MHDIEYTRAIWVSSNGRNTASGTETSPVRTISRAIEMARPGDAIFVKEGIYNENVQIGGRDSYNLRNTTVEKPITLVSVDGQGKAIITPSNHDKTTVLITAEHVRFYDFEVRGKAYDQLDEAAIKVIGNPDIRSGVGDVVISGNLITGSGVDGIKAGKMKDLVITGNRFEMGVKEDFIDFVSTWDSEISFNTFIGDSRRALNFKAGSQNIDVSNNLIHLTSSPERPELPVIGIGGDGFSRDDRAPLPPSFTGFEAKDVRVVENVIFGDNMKTVAFRGAIDSLVQGNLLFGRGSTAITSERSQSSTPYKSADNKIIGNVYRDDMQLHSGSTTQSSGLKISGNRIGDQDDTFFYVGADRVLSNSLDDLIERDQVVGDFVFTVRAGGTGSSVAPQFALVADGEVVGVAKIVNPVSGAFNETLGSNYRNYEFTYRGIAPEEIDVRFLNGGYDRTSNSTLRLYVDHIAVNGSVFEAEHMGTFSKHNTPDLSEGQRDKMYTSGDLSFDRLYYSGRWPEPRNPVVEPDSVGLSLRIAGVGSTRVPPSFSVIADGETIAVESISSPGTNTQRRQNKLTYETLDFALDTTPSEVSIVFTNDGGRGKFDRSLIVDWFEVDGVRLEAESDSIYTRRNGDVMEGYEIMRWNGTMTFEFD